MPAVGIGIVMIALGIILLLFVSPVAGIILLVIGALALALGFTAFGGPGYGPRRGDVTVIRDRRPRRRRVVEERDVI